VPDDPDALPLRGGLADSRRVTHASLSWNPATQEWYCRDCGRTSDHQSIEYARAEMEHFPCALPAYVPPAFKVGQAAPGKSK